MLSLVNIFRQVQVWKNIVNIDFDEDLDFEDELPVEDNAVEEVTEAEADVTTEEDSEE